jgi:hypothetical protein
MKMKDESELGTRELEAPASGRGAIAGAAYSGLVHPSYFII